MKNSLALLGASLASAAALYLTCFNPETFVMAAGTYKVLSPTTQENLTVFPIVGQPVSDTSRFLTLDEGLKNGQVVIEEQGRGPHMVRPRSRNGGIFPDTNRGAEVNRLLLSNKSDRPLLLLAGEIVTGGKQDRVIGKDRIVAPNSEPVDIGVFCVEPHRWVETSARFDSLNFAMAQPGVRAKAMAAKDQQRVWDEVAKSRAAVAGILAPSAAREVQSTSSYAVTMAAEPVKKAVDDMARPAYEKLAGELRARGAIGAVVAVNGEIVWADIFASPALLQKYWPKLVHSYAAEAVTNRRDFPAPKLPLFTEEAQTFVNHLSARHENVESEPGVYRNTELFGDDFHAFVLSSLLPNLSFDVHIAKMKDEREARVRPAIYPR